MKTIRNFIAAAGLVGLLGCGQREAPEAKALTRQLLPPPAADEEAREKLMQDCKSNPSFVPYKSNEEISMILKNFIDGNYTRIAAEQKRRFGYRNIHVPQYTYESVPSDSRFVNSGEYDLAKRMFIFYFSNSVNTSLKLVDHSKQIFEVYNCEAFTPPMLKDSMDHMIRHELGHAYFFARAKQLGKKNWFRERNSNDDGDNIQKKFARKIVGEGFGEYMAIRGRSYEWHLSSLRECDDEEMRAVPNNYSNIIHYDVYACGYTLIAPILDRSFHKGLNYLLSHPPTEGDLNDLVAWRTNALEALN